MRETRVMLFTLALTKGFLTMIFVLLAYDAIHKLEKYFTEIQAKLDLNSDVKNRLRFGSDLNSYFQFLVIARLTNDEKILESNVFIKLANNVEKYIKDKQIDVIENKVNIVYKLKNVRELKKNDVDLDIENASEKYIDIVNNEDMLLNSVIIQLVIILEEYFTNLFDFLVWKFQGLYLSGKMVSYENLPMEISSKKDIIRILANDELDRLMKQGVLSCISKLEKDHKIPKLETKTKEDLTELINARNIVVHNARRVDKIFLANTGEKKLELNSRLNIDENYIYNCFEIIHRTITHISMSLVKLIDESDKDNLLKSVQSDAFSNMQYKKWKIALNEYSYLSKYDEKGSELNVLNKVNSWICRKNLCGVENIRDEVLVFDFTLFDDQYNMAKCFLLDDYENGMQFLETLFPKSITKHDLENWPLFNQFRQTEYYNIFRKDHFVDFETRSILYDEIFDEIENDEEARKISN